MKGEKRNLRSVKVLVIAMWAVAVILAGLLLGFLIVSCTARSSNPTKTPAFTSTRLSTPPATSTPEISDIPLTKTAASTVKALLEETPINTQTSTHEIPTPSATITPTEAMMCQWPPQRVLIFSMDALRPEAVRDMNAAPFLLGFAKGGSYTWNAQTTSPSITMTGHLSMLTGYDAPTHGVIDNQIWQTPETRVEIPTIFQRAKQANLITALFAGKGQFYYIERGGFLDYSFVDKKAKDVEIAERAAAYIQNDDFNLMFVHFPDVDKAGHNYGWMSNEYLNTVRKADNEIGMIIGVLEAKGIRDSTLIIVTSDHGGTGITHGDPYYLTNVTIPWMISGPCVRTDYQIAQNVNVFDTAAMALWGLGIEIPADLDGKLICDVFGSPVSSQCLEAQPKR